MPSPGSDPFTLAVDCGGGGIKASVLDAAGTLHAPAVRVPTPYPLPPERLVATIADIAAGLPDRRPRDRRDAGDDPARRRRRDPALRHPLAARAPRSTPTLVAAWAGCDIRAAVEERLGLPTLVLNDAEVHGAGVISGTGVELVLTLGTGLGTALFDGGVLAPHLELSHAPVRWGTTYDAYIGQVERARLGDALWSRRVRRVVDGFRPGVRAGTGSTSAAGTPGRSPRTTLARLGDDVVVVPNQAGIVGGVRAWSLGR